MNRYCVLLVLLCLVGGWADAQDAATPELVAVGEFVRTFEERSPLSPMKKQVRRDPWNGRMKPPEYSLSQHPFRIYVPEGYVGDGTYGVLVWVSPANEAAVPYQEILKRNRLIGICPQNAGNPVSFWTRAGLALDAAHNITKNYVVDPNRVYVSGFSGGGRMASRLGIMYADVFRGAFPIDGVDWWEDLPADEQPGKWYQGRFAKPSSKLWKRAKKESRYVLMTGERDGNRGGTRAAYKHGYKKARFKNVVYVEIPDKGHQMPAAEWFHKGIEYLDRGAKADKKKSRKKKPDKEETSDGSH